MRGGGEGEGRVKVIGIMLNYNGIMKGDEEKVKFIRGWESLQMPERVVEAETWFKKKTLHGCVNELS